MDNMVCRSAFYQQLYNTAYLQNFASTESINVRCHQHKNTLRTDT